MTQFASFLRGFVTIQRIYCRFGVHNRDRGAVRRFNKQWRSICTGCGASLVKTDKGWMRRIDMAEHDGREAASDRGL